MRPTRSTFSKAIRSKPAQFNWREQTNTRNTRNEVFARARRANLRRAAVERRNQEQPNHNHRAAEARIGEYDPRVGKRILLGKSITASDYLTLGDLRAEFIRDTEALCAGFDAILMPTVPCVAPTIAQADASDEDYFRWNVRILRNNGLINFLDGCAASLPCHEPGGAPVGLMVCGLAGAEHHTLTVAAAIERALGRD